MTKQTIPKIFWIVVTHKKQYKTQRKEPIYEIQLYSSKFDKWIRCAYQDKDLTPTLIEFNNHLELFGNETQPRSHRLKRITK